MVLLLIAMVLTAKPMTAADRKQDAQNRAFVKKTLKQCKRSGCDKCGRFFYQVPDLAVSEVRYEPTYCEVEYYRWEAAYNVQVQDGEIRDRYEEKP